MRRGLSLAVVVLLLVGGVLVRARPQPGQGVGPGRRNRRHEGRWRLRDHRRARRALLLEVFLQGRTDTASATLGSAAAPWHRLVSLRRDPDVALGDAVTLGAPRMMGVALDGAKPSLLASDDAAIATIVGRQRTEQRCTSTLLRGHINSAHRAPDHQSGRRFSDILTRLRDRDRAHARSRARARRRSAVLCARRAGPSGGKKIAEDVLARQPDDVSAHTAIGDALKGLGRLWRRAGRTSKRSKRSGPGGIPRRTRVALHLNKGG